MGVAVRVGVGVAVRVGIGVGMDVGDDVMVGVNVNVAVGVGVSVGSSGTLIDMGNSGPKMVASPDWMRQTAECVPGVSGAIMSTTISALPPAFTTGKAFGELAPIKSPLVWTTW